MYCSLFNKSESFTLSDKVAFKNFKVVYFVRQYLELQLLTPFVCLTISNITAVILKHLYNLNILSCFLTALWCHCELYHNDYNMRFYTYFYMHWLKFKSISINQFANQYDLSRNHESSRQGMEMPMWYSDA